jgi:hypothetical protein
MMLCARKVIQILEYGQGLLSVGYDSYIKAAIMESMVAEMVSYLGCR